MRYKPIIWILLVSTTLVSCALFKASCRQTGTMSKQANADSASVIYSDSVDKILLYASKVRFYDMADFVNVQDSLEKHDSIFNYEIKKDIGVIDKKEKGVLSFIISDRKWYIEKYAQIRHPFHPNIALEFFGKRGKAYMFVSFVTGEVAIATAEKQFKFYLMSDARPMARWANALFPNEEYYKELVK